MVLHVATLRCWCTPGLAEGGRLFKLQQAGPYHADEPVQEECNRKCVKGYHVHNFHTALLAGRLAHAVDRVAANRKCGRETLPRLLQTSRCTAARSCCTRWGLLLPNLQSFQPDDLPLLIPHLSSGCRHHAVRRREVDARAGAAGGALAQARVRLPGADAGAGGLYGRGHRPHPQVWVGAHRVHRHRCGRPARGAVSGSSDRWGVRHMLSVNAMVLCSGSSRLHRRPLRTLVLARRQ